MSFLTILETLFLGPLKLIFELIFVAASNIVGHIGYAIIFLSLAMNFLVLPLYRRADAMQEKARDVEEKLRDGVAHIKKTFTGDERMMMLQTYYRQNNYKPTDALNGSVSLLLEIPFFMAAYQFLSNLDILDGVAFGPIADLGAPDGLLVIGGVAINVLPILMTLINVISSAIYLKGFPLKTKIQLYAIAAFFLVFLYESPACLVFYWTLNNVFSLAKNIFYKLKKPKQALCAFASLVGFALILYGAFFFDSEFLREKGYAVGAGLLLQIPMVIHMILGDAKPSDNSKKSVKKTADSVAPNRNIFIFGGLLLTIFIGVLIPSNILVASPQEFVDVTYYYNPLWYIVSSVCLAAGTFLVWMGVFYWLASPKGKIVFERVVWILCGVMLVNYMFFGTDLGILSATLKYENGLHFDVDQQTLNIAVLVAVIAVMFFVIKKWTRVVSTVLLVGVVSLGAMSAINVFSINKSIKEISLEQAEKMPHFELSKSGKNVIVFMLDRGMASYVPYLFNEDPNLQKQFAGFTFYKNTISFGRSTNLASPALLGGYEYTPVEINKRGDESLASKQNEALKVMPVLFSQNGYDVTVCDPMYANYQWIPDLSIYDEYPDINAFITNGQFTDNSDKQDIIDNSHRNFFCFGLLKSMPLSLQNVLYNDGNYNQVAVSTSQKANGIYTSVGYNPEFHGPYNVLLNLDTMTNVTGNNKDTFLFISNETAHEPMLLQTPDYVPSYYVDNTKYETENADRFTLNGITLKMNKAYGLGHYHVNMAAMKQLGAWFDYLRAEGVYDNTKIILVADHGQHLFQIPELVKNGTDLCSFYPMLMVKDFNSREFTVSDEFMTNADVPTIAFDGLIENPVNPFTGNLINSDEKYAHDQFIILSGVWDIKKNNGNTFLPSKWASVSENFWDKSKWTFYNKEMVLTEHYVK